MSLSDAEIRFLLAQPEGSGLDFKKSLDIYHKNDEVKKRARDEFIRDVLAMANGNVLTAGQPGYLIFGVDDELKADSPRKLYGITGNIPTSTKILDIINPACSPRLEDIEVQTCDIDGYQLLILIIPPSPHLHEITRELITKDGKVYSIYTAFMRQNEQIRPASIQECNAISKAKQRFFSQENTIRALYLSSFVGAVMFGTYGFASSAEYLGVNLISRLIIMGISGLAGGLVGLSLGFAIEQYWMNKNELATYPYLIKILLIGFGILVITALFIYYFLLGVKN